MQQLDPGKRCFVLYIFFFLSLTSASGQNLDTTFNLGGIPQRTYWDGDNLLGSGSTGIPGLHLQSDSKVLLGGPFGPLKGSSSANVARLTPTGLIDSSFSANVDWASTVQKVILGIDGKITICGSFAEVNGAKLKGIARLDYFGERDHLFNIGGTGAASSVLCFIYQPDGKLIIGGSFTNYNGLAYAHLARLHSDGTLDSGFSPTIGFRTTLAAPLRSVSSLQLQPDGKILIGGSFNQVNSTAMSGIARLNENGTVDTSFAVGAGIVNGSPSNLHDVSALAVQADGKIVVGGRFQTYNTVSRINLARLNPDGSVDSLFQVTNVNDTVHALTLLDDGKIYVGGTFNAINGISRTRIAKLNPDGSVDAGYNPTVSGVQTFQVLNIAQQANGYTLLSGYFTTINGTMRSNIARLSGSAPFPSAPQFLAEPPDLTVPSGGNPAFVASASGYPLSYQWLSNGVPMLKATNAILALSSVAPQMNAGFSAVVSNSLGVITSRVAVLTVTNTAPVFVRDPLATNVNAGWNINLSAKALGFPAYQWSLNSVNIEGATNSALTLTNVTAANAGTYWLLASNNFGFSTSAPVIVKVKEAPATITTQPTNVTVAHGFPATLSVGVTGIPLPFTQWMKNGTNIPGANSASFTILEARPGDEGSYSVFVSNYLASATSQSVTLTVLPPTTVTGLWYTNDLVWISGGHSGWTAQTNVTYDGGDAAQSGVIGNSQRTFLETTVVGPALLRFRWKVSSRSGDTLQFLTNGTAITAISGEVDWQPVTWLLASGTNVVRWLYSKDLVFTAGQDKGWIDAVTIGPLEEPVVLAHPPSARSATERGYATLSAEVTGASPLNLQWRFNGTDIPAATNLTLMLTNVSAADVGSYALFAQNNLGSITTSNALFTVTPITESPIMSVLWRKLPNSTSWLTNDGAHSYRGVAYNPLNNHALVISRSNGTNIWVLDGNTGEELYTLNLGTNVSGGTYSLNMIGVDDAGAIYAGNLTLDSKSDPFRLYRWVNDDPTTTPTLVWEGDPARGGTSTRWGDTLDVFGSGPNVKIILGANGNSTSSPHACIIKPGEGVNADPLPLVVPGAFGVHVRVAFASADTFWMKSQSDSLRYVSFADGTPVVLKTYSGFPVAIAGLAGNLFHNSVACITLESPDTLRLYSVPGVTNNPVWLDTEFFLHPIDELNGFSTGSIDYSDRRIYAIDSNNGIVAVQVAPVITSSLGGTNLLLSWPWGTLESATDPVGPFEQMNNISSPTLIPINGESRFFRVRY